MIPGEGVTSRKTTASGNAIARLGRSDRSALGRWFWTVDRALLLMVLVLIGCGLVAVLAASPAASYRYSGASHRVGELYYFKRQLFWAFAGLAVMVGTSMLTRDWARRAALAGAVLFSVLLAMTPLIGSSANGATRWIGVGAFALQPSEFLKPCIIVTTAWLLALRFEDRNLPTMQVSAALMGLICLLLIQQPDYGQTALFGAVWIAQAMLAGLSLPMLAVIGVLAVVGAGAAYLTVHHFASRIDRFFTGTGDTYQIDKALEAFRNGGLFGTGPGEGRVKLQLPEPHTDYIFAVIGEEFGAIACIAVAALILAVVARVLLRLVEEEDPFLFLATAGLITQFALQSFINMGVALSLLPAKGMTLPFVSHGGSSMVALSFGMGLLLAFTRRNEYLKKSPYLNRWTAS
jgi:cell division protein FtsW